MKTQSLVLVALAAAGAYIYFKRKSCSSCTTAAPAPAPSQYDAAFSAPALHAPEVHWFSGTVGRLAQVSINNSDARYAA